MIQQYFILLHFTPLQLFDKIRIRRLIKFNEIIKNKS